MGDVSLPPRCNCGLVYGTLRCVGCPETSVNNYQPTPPNVPEERIVIHGRQKPLELVNMDCVRLLNNTVFIVKSPLCSTQDGGTTQQERDPLKISAQLRTQIRMDTVNTYIANIT